MHIISPLWENIYIIMPTGAFMSHIALNKSREYMADNWPISTFPEQIFFGPSSAPYPAPQLVLLTLEELEALRLVDYLGIDEKEAAKLQNQSEQDFDAILKSGRKKIASAFLYYRLVRIEGTTSFFQRIDDND